MQFGSPCARPVEHLGGEVDGGQFGVTRIEGQVVPRADADLENVAGGATASPATATVDVEEPRGDPHRAVVASRLLGVRATDVLSALASRHSARAAYRW
jgi:hypothetical protein